MNSDGTLPKGVHIVAFYDRGDLVAITVNTVFHNMAFGVVLIFLIQWLFLGDFRSALIVAATIPVALLLAVIITVLRGKSANLLSIGAIDLGIIVDASVIMVENIYRHLAHHTRGAFAVRRGPSRKAQPHSHRGCRSRLGDFLFGCDHHRCVPAAVHHAGRGGPDLWTDGAHLCLRADRVGDCDLHHHAGARLRFAAGEIEEVDTSWCAGSARSTKAFCRSRSKMRGSPRRSLRAF